MSKLIEHLNLDWKKAVDEYPIVCITTNGTVKRDGSGIMGAGVAGAARELVPSIEVPHGNALRMFGNVPASLGFLSNGTGRWPRSPVRSEWREDLHADPGPFYCWIWTLPVKHRIEDAADLRLVVQSMMILDWKMQKVAGDRKVAIPRPGCGVGGLTWPNVRFVLEGLGFGGEDSRYVFFTNESK